MKQLGLAMHNYATMNKCFPPAYVAAPNGKLLYSWRALVLPFFEDKTLAKRFHYDEPWDSEANHKLWKDGRKWFQCPTSDHASDDCTTDYVMVVGPHTFSDGPHGRKFGDITDGFSNTIMLVEVADSGINWAEPKDLEFDKIDFKINGQKPCVGSHHSHGANAALCDGSVRFFDNKLAPEMLKAALTIDGGKKVNLDD
jgi:prepilin-type processing-associated H-X9-DG protein